jgi:hypothetical protein
VESSVASLVLEPDDLIAPVRHALQVPAERVRNWHVRPLSGGFEASSSVYHVTGDAWANDQQVSWAVILKIIRPTVDRLTQTHWNYWQREADAYRSGWLQADTAGLAAPRCYHISERADGSIWLWLEVLQDTASKPWFVTTYERVAYQLGIFSGSHRVHDTIGTEPWMSGDWLRRYVNEYGQPLTHVPNLHTHPMLAKHFPPARAHALLHLWQHREAFLARLDRLPQVICHLDAWENNLFVTQLTPAAVRVVAVDWAFVGSGAVGQELAPLIGMSATLSSDPGRIDVIEEAAIAAYLDGLSAHGWHGTERDVRLGYTIAMALTYGLGGTGWMLGIMLDERQHAWWEQATGKPIEAGLEQLIRLTDISLQRANQIEHLVD